MIRWVALLRGVNVGGKNILPMKELRGLLETLGFGDVRTYIQSGNCVFSSELDHAGELASLISGAIEKAFGFRPEILAIRSADFAKAIIDNPYPEGLDDPKSVHISFLAKEPSDPDIGKLSELKTPSERFHLSGARFYLHAPEGIGRSRLASQAERFLGVPATARNLRSALKIAELAG